MTAMTPAQPGWYARKRGRGTRRGERTRAPLPVGAAAYRRPRNRMGEMAGGLPRPPERPGRQPDTIAAEPSRAEARARSSPGWILWLAVRGSSSSVKKSTCRGTL